MAKQKRGGQKSPGPTGPRSASGGRGTNARPAPRTPHIPRGSVIVLVVAVVVLVLGGAMVLGSGGSGGSRPGATPTVPVLAGASAASISAQEAAVRWQAGAVLLDVREDGEWAAGHAPGAVHIPLGQLASRTAELPTDESIMVICRSGNRSQQGRDILISAGLDSVTSVEGGVRAWRDAGLPYEGAII